MFTSVVFLVQLGWQQWALLCGRCSGCSGPLQAGRRRVGKISTALRPIFWSSHLLDILFGALHGGWILAWEFNWLQWVREQYGIETWIETSVNLRQSTVSSEFAVMNLYATLGYMSSNTMANFTTGVITLMTVSDAFNHFKCLKQFTSDSFFFFIFTVAIKLVNQSG